MPIDNSSVTNLLNIESIWQIFRILFLIIAFLYFIFTLIIIRQITLMTNTITTESSSLLKAIGILYAGLALGVIVLLVGILL